MSDTANFVKFYSEKSESWKRDHDEAMRNYDAAEELSIVVELGILCFNSLTVSPKPHRSVEFSIGQYERFGRWHAVTLDVLNAADELMAAGCEVARTGELRQIARQVSQAGLDDRIASLKEIQSGNCVSGDEFVAQLRRQRS